MAKIKFRSNVAELSEEKSPDAYFDSGATHHFFYHRSSFISYTDIEETPVRGASTITKVVGKRLVKLSIGNGIKVEAYQAPKFSSNIISLGILYDDYDIVLCKSIRGYRACF